MVIEFVLLEHHGIMHTFQHVPLDGVLDTCVTLVLLEHTLTFQIHNIVPSVLQGTFQKLEQVYAHHVHHLYQVHLALLAQLAPTLTLPIKCAMPAQQASTEAQPLPTGDHTPGSGRVAVSP